MMDGLHWRWATLGCAVGLFAAGCDFVPAAPTSTLIRNAVIIDGTGNPGFNGAVRIDGDRIVAVGDLEPRPREHTIDAAGLVLAPGFIDVHSHYDLDIANHPGMPAALSQGITTFVKGGDGDSGTDERFGYVSQAELQQHLANNPIAINVASLAGHGSIRYAIMGDDFRRPATTAEIEKMQALLHADMRDGAIGLGAGLEYEPGIHSVTAEVIELARVAAEYGGLYASHLRDEDDRFIPAVEEIIRIGREANLPVHIAHIKIADRAFWGTTDKVIGLLDAARASGVDVTADIYPYLRWQSNLAVLFPDRDFTNRKSAEYTFEHTSTADDIILTEYGPNPGYAGKSVADLARLMETDTVSTLLELTAAADEYAQETGLEGAYIIAKGMDETDVVKFMQWEHSSFCTDGSHELGHPRGYGAFPRVLRRYVRELGVLRLEQAVQKMTSKSANAMRLQERGRIAVGNFADIVLFDAQGISDHADMTDPDNLSTGVSRVWVNGQLAYADGEPSGNRAGRLLTLRDN